MNPVLVRRVVAGLVLASAVCSSSAWALDPGNYTVQCAAADGTRSSGAVDIRMDVVDLTPETRECMRCHREAPMRRERDDGVDARVDPLDPVEVGLQLLARRHLPVPQPSGQRGRGLEAQLVGHAPDARGRCCGCQPGPARWLHSPSIG